MSGHWKRLAVLATLGHIVIFGFLAGVGETNTQAEVVKHFAKAPTISYSEIYATYFSNYPLVKRSMESIYALLDKGLVTPVYSTVPLSEAGTAHEQLQAGKVMGKLLLVP